MSGFIAMQREALEHPLFRGNPDRFYAWFWLVARAAWRPTGYDIGGKVITLQRGQLCASVRQLADAWGMSKSAVERFVTRLKTETMVETEAGQGRLVITICNYNKYQDLEVASRDTSGTPAGQQRDIKEPLNHGTIQEAKASCAPKARKSAPLKSLPDDWQPLLTPAAQRVVDGWPPGRLEREAATFRDHAADKGRTSRDWQAAFRKWIENAEKWHPGHGKQQQRNGPASTLDAMRRAIELTGGPEKCGTAAPRTDDWRADALPDPVRAIGYVQR